MVSILYVITALVTGLHCVYRLMDVVNGAPVHPLNAIALFGSVVLLCAAALVRFRPRAAAKTALAGSLLLWVFYLPMLVVSFSMPFSTWQEIRTAISLSEYVPLTGMLLGPLLLAASTLTEIRTIRARQSFS
jgi:hypothetical protein